MKWLLLCIVSLSLVSCSYLTDFYIFNDTSEAIEITYKVKRTEAYAPFVTAPKIHPFKATTKIKDAINVNAANLLQDSLTVRTILQPKQALWIGVDSNFSLKYDAEILSENLEQLTIKQAGEIMTFSPNEAVAKFQEISYKIVGILISEKP